LIEEVSNQETLKEGDEEKGSRVQFGDSSSMFSSFGDVSPISEGASRPSENPNSGRRRILFGTVRGKRVRKITYKSSIFLVTR